MSDDPKQAPEEKQPVDDDTPAHSTPEERERLKDYNKDGIPPGGW